MHNERQRPETDDQQFSQQVSSPEGWHYSPLNFQLIPCYTTDCKSRFHSTHEDEAKLSADLAKEHAELMLTANGIQCNVNLRNNGVRGYIDGAFISSVGELVVITAEETLAGCQGRVTVGQREFVLYRSSATGTGELSACFKATLQLMASDLAHEVWPKHAAAKLKKLFNENSTDDSISAPGLIELQAKENVTRGRVLYGKTHDGVPLTVMVIDGYIVAEAELQGSSVIIYENATSEALSEAELHTFLAKAYCELIADS